MWGLFLRRNKELIDLRITNYSELSNNLKVFFDGVIDNCESLMVHQEVDKSVVVLSLEEYNAIQETAYIMKSSSMMDLIRKGDEVF